jgi:hypothetical protein
MKLNGLTIEGADEMVDGTYYLISKTSGRDEWWVLQEEPGRTNLSHEPKIRGWLGETNNVSRHALGRVELYTNRAGHRRVRRLPDEE